MYSGFLVLISILFYIDFTTYYIVYFKRYNKSFKRDICCLDFRSNFLVSISFLINIGKEMSLPGFRIKLFHFVKLPEKTSSCSGLRAS